MVAVLTWELPAGGRYNARNVPAKFLVLQRRLLSGDYQLAGAPGWLEHTRYDIVAKVNSPGQISEEQLKPLLQAMLVDRFSLRFHRELREFPGYSLIVGRSGAKFAANTSAQEPGLSISSNRVGAKMTATKMPITALSKQLGDTLGRTVADNTGLKGNFDFKLEWTPPETANATDPSIFTSLQEQLGLKFPDVFTAVREQLGLKLDAVRKTPAGGNRDRQNGTGVGELKAG